MKNEADVEMADPAAQHAAHPVSNGNHMPETVKKIEVKGKATRARDIIDQIIE